MKARTRIAACAALIIAVSLGAVHNAQSGVPADAARAPKTIEVKMTNEGGTVRFEPKDITIQAGDTVRWIAAGGSHNVQFWADSVPQGAVDLLKKVTSDTLATQRFPNAGDTFTIVFAGYPKGTYKYYCTPHLRRSMTASIIIQ